MQKKKKINLYTKILTILNKCTLNEISSFRFFLKMVIYRLKVINIYECCLAFTMTFDTL